MNHNTLQVCTELIKRANNIVVLTGAGISTESGIKDFRSSTGIYRLAPEYVLSLHYFYKYPKEFYQFALEHLYHPNAIPNKGHEILALWEKKGVVSHIITQNIDGLHQKAGSDHVIEFHGTMKTCTCMNCGKKYVTQDMVNRMNQMEDFYVCNDCDTRDQEDRYIKPDVVLFGDVGEWFTTEGFQTIHNLIHHADLLLVLGTSLKVTPFSTFPQNRRNDVSMILINKGDSPYDHTSGTYVIHDSIGDTLTKMNESLT
jgi:NAD-dependent deacetylase